MYEEIKDFLEKEIKESKTSSDAFINYLKSMDGETNINLRFFEDHNIMIYSYQKVLDFIKQLEQKNDTK